MFSTTCAFVTMCPSVSSTIPLPTSCSTPPVAVCRVLSTRTTPGRVLAATSVIALVCSTVWGRAPTVAGDALSAFGLAPESEPPRATPPRSPRRVHPGWQPPADASSALHPGPPWVGAGAPGDSGVSAGQPGVLVPPPPPPARAADRPSTTGTSGRWRPVQPVGCASLPHMQRLVLDAHPRRPCPLSIAAVRLPSLYCL